MNRKSLLVLFFKVFVFLGILAQGIYLFVFKADIGSQLQDVFDAKINVYLIVLTGILMLFNWSMEAVKWQYTVKWIKEISFVESLKTVLLGLAFSFFTPRGIGEYFARAYTLDVTRKLPVILSLLLARMSQLFVLILGGVVAGVLMFDKVLLLSGVNVDVDIAKLVYGVIGLGVALVIIIFLYIRYKVKVKQIVKLLKKSGLLSLGLVSLVTGMSLVRYLTYCFQFVLLVLALGVEGVSLLELFAVVMLTFFVKALIPVFNFMSDLGVREVFAIVFLSMVGVIAEIALSASLLLWLINIVIPTIVGAFLVFKMKIKW